MIEIKNISKKYGRTLILDNISFNIEKGDCIGVVGRNGAGKSTLLSILSGTGKPDSGEFIINNKNIFQNKKMFRTLIGYVPQENPLINDENCYHINFEELERKLSDTQTTMMILCNPHNPVGKIWSKEELERIGELCYKYGVIVVSDEIHCDITTPGKGYIPFASVSDKCRDISISCVAPTKAFNMAGLQTSAIIVPNERMRAKVNRGINTDEVAEPNYFAIQAAVAAFTKGGEWLDELRTYIYENKMTVKKYIDENLKDVKTEVTDATYLMWIDCRNITDDSKRLAAFIRKNTGLYVSAGEQYGKAGEGYIRMNVACCREALNDGLERFKNGINMYRKRQN